MTKPTEEKRELLARIWTPNALAYTFDYIRECVGDGTRYGKGRG